MELLISILKNMPDALSLGLVWGIMAIGVYITFKVLDIPDMTVDGTFALGGCIVAATITTGVNPVISMVLAVICGMAAGLVTGILHTKLKIPAILAGILTMLAIYSIDLMSAYASLGYIIGEEMSDDLVNEIFSKFCVGK